MSRNEKCFCGSGKKLKKCHSTVENNSKLADMYVKYAQFDSKVEKDGLKARCPKMCSSCCNDFFFISENEFLLILDSLLRKGGKTLVNSYIEKANEYQDYLMKHYPNIMRDLDSYMPDGKDVVEVRAYFNDNYNWNRSVSCIFLENGRCSIYEERPHICRIYGVCQTCEIINNKEIHFEEENELIWTEMIVGERTIMKRPYPLFYYFSFFMNSTYYDMTMQKLLMIRSKTERKYAEFTENII